MIQVQITTAKHRAKDRLFLLAIAPTGHILSRKMVGSSLTPSGVAERVREFTAHWTGQLYQPLDVCASIESYLL